MAGQYLKIIVIIYFLCVHREIKKIKETKKIFDKMGYDLNKYEEFFIVTVLNMFKEFTII